MCLHYSHHQTSVWLIKSKMMVWKPICQEIFRFDLHGQTLIFCCKSLTVKFHVKYFFITTITFVFMVNQRSSNEKQTNMYDTRLQVEVVPQTRGHRTKFIGFTLQTCDFAPLTRWRHKLRKGICIPKNLKNLLISSSSLGSIAISISVS